MAQAEIACARCGGNNHPSNRYCEICALPLGGPTADSGAGLDALGPYEALDPSEPDPSPAIRNLVERAGFEATAASHGWRMLVPLHGARSQAVYIGPAGTDLDGRVLLALISICGPANERDLRSLLKLNSRMIEGHFAIKMLRGEEYFVVVRTLAADSVMHLPAALIVRRIALAADGLEDRLSRGRDIY